MRLFLGVWVFVVVACVSCKNETVKIGFMLPHMGVQRYVIEKEEFSLKAKQMGAEVVFASAGNDEEKQNLQFDSLLNQNVNIIVLDPVNRFTAAAMVRKAHDKGIKVISYDRLVANCEIDAYISFDAVMTGVQMTSALTKAVPSGNYVVFGGDKSDINALGVDEGEESVLAPLVKSGKIKIAYKSFIERWDADEVAMELRHYLDWASEQPDAILASSDVLAKGVVAVLKERGLAGKIQVVGQGGELFACKNIVGGSQVMTVYKPVKKLADLAVQLAIDMNNQKDVKATLNTVKNNGAAEIPTHLLPTVPVDASNIKSTIVADGMFKESDLK